MEYRSTSRKQLRAVRQESYIMYNASILSATSRIVGALITSGAGATRERGHCSQWRSPGGCASVSSCRDRWPSTRPPPASSAGGAVPCSSAPRLAMPQYPNSHASLNAIHTPKLTKHSFISSVCWAFFLIYEINIFFKECARQEKCSPFY